MSRFSVEAPIEKLERSTIIHGDSLEMMKMLPDKSIHLVFSSPPYAGVIRKYVEGDPRDLGQLEPDEYIDRFMPYIHEVCRVLRHEEGCVFILNLGEKYQNGFASLYPERLMLRIIKETPLRVIDKVPWIKTDPMPGKKSRHGTIAWEHIIIFGSQPDKINKNNDFMRRPYETSQNMIADKRDIKQTRKQTGHKMNEAGCFNNIGAEPSNWIVCSTQGVKGSNHKAQMPERLAEYFVGAYSQERQFVLDPFGGGGTTSAVSWRMNREFVHIDLSEHNCEIAENRIAQIPQRKNLFNIYGLDLSGKKEKDEVRKRNNMENKPLF